MRGRKRQAATEGPERKVKSVRQNDAQVGGLVAPAWRAPEAPMVYNRTV